MSIMSGLVGNRNGTSGLRLAVSGNMTSPVRPGDEETSEGRAGAGSLAAMNGAALLRAVKEGNLGAVKALLAEGTDANAKDGDEWTALMLATIKGHLEVAQALLDGGADVCAKNHKGWTALRFAVSLNDTEIMRLLLESGADVNDQDAEGNTALMQAAGEKSVEGLNLLLTYGADVCARNHSDETALMIAAQHGYSDVVQLLKNGGAVSEGRRDAGTDPGLFSDDELQQLMEKIDGLVPLAADGDRCGETQALAPAATAPHSALDRLVVALEALRAGEQQAARRISIADVAHKLTLTLPEAAALSGLSRRHLRQAMKEGEIKSRKTGQGWRIKRAELEAYVKKL